MIQAKNTIRIMPNNLINILWTTYYSIYKIFDDNDEFIWSKNNKSSVEMIIEKLCIRIPFCVCIENSYMEDGSKDIIFEKINNKIKIMQTCNSNIIHSSNKQYNFEYKIIFKDENSSRNKISEDTYLQGEVEFALKSKNS